MINTVKKKLRLGTFLIFLLVLLSVGVGIFNVMRLKEDANKIIKNNYESLDYCHEMQRLIDTSGDVQEFFVRFDAVLRNQEANVTEAGEEEATQKLRMSFNNYRSNDSTSDQVSSMRRALQQVLQLNMSAIEHKNRVAISTANKAVTYISSLAAIVFLIGFVFLINFPYILTSPIQKLKDSIQEISRGNYKHRIHLERNDEFGDMAYAFNEMADRLEFFENSNLNKIMFEKARAEAVINSLKEASIGIDKNGIILFANNQALQLLGASINDLVGKPATEVATRNDLFRFLLEEKSSLPFKIVLDNRENYFIKETLIIDEDNSNSRVIVLSNITSFKEMDVAKTHFIATISHELKTPLASSDFSLKLLEDERIGHLSTEQMELLQNLKTDNQRMLRILSELLNMSQVETGKIQLQIAAVDPAFIINAALTTTAAAARQKKIAINVSNDAGSVKVNADAEKTSWVLNNLLSNAIKYTPEESALYLRTWFENEKMFFSVADSGPGIDHIFKDKIFDRFFIVPGTKGGTGLGLSISKEFIEVQGGRIWVESELGKGSVFIFFLPTAAS